MLVGHGHGAIAIMPYYGFLRPDPQNPKAETLRLWFKYDASCGLSGLPLAEAHSSGIGAGSAVFEFWTARGPGASWIVLVKPPDHADNFAEVSKPSELYPVPGDRGGAAALSVFAQGAAVALAALCPPKPSGGDGADEWEKCLGAVYHGGNMARSLLVARQVNSDEGQVLRVDPDLQTLYFIHDGLSELGVYMDEEDLSGRLGAFDAAGVSSWYRPSSARSLERFHTDDGPRPGLEVVTEAVAWVVNPAYICLTQMAALHADAVSTVSPSLARALLPGGAVLTQGATARALQHLHDAGRLWAVPPVAQAPSPSLKLPMPTSDSPAAAKQLWAAKATARVTLLGPRYAGSLMENTGRRFVALFVGRFEANKGAAMMVGLGRQLCHDGGHLVVLSTGPTDSVGKEAWRELVQWGEAAPECVTMVEGRDPHLGPLARASADVCIAPSWLEGYGLVAAEALQHGCYLVASDTTGLGDIVQAANADDLNGRWDVPPHVLAAHPELQMLQSIPHVDDTASHRKCPSRFARVFPIMGGRGGRMYWEMRRAMASPLTVDAAARAILSAVADLRSCGDELASLNAIRAGAQMPTMQSTAARVRAVLQGLHARRKPPVRLGKAELKQIVAEVEAASDAGEPIRIRLSGPMLTLKWRLAESRARCGSVAVLRASSKLAPQAQVVEVHTEANAGRATTIGSH